MAYRHAQAAVQAERLALAGGPHTPSKPMLLALAETHRMTLDGVLLRAWVGAAARDEAQAWWRQGRRDLAALAELAVLTALEPQQPAPTQEGASMGNGASATNHGQGVARSPGRRGYFTAPTAASSATAASASTASATSTSTSAPKATASKATASKATASKATASKSASPKASTPKASTPKTARGAGPKPKTAPHGQAATPAALAFHRATRPEGGRLERVAPDQYRLSLPDASGKLISRMVTGAELNAAYREATRAGRAEARGTLRAAGQAGKKAAGLEHAGRRKDTSAGHLIHHDLHSLWRTFRQSHDIVKKVRRVL